MKDSLSELNESQLMQDKLFNANLRLFEEI